MRYLRLDKNTAAGLFLTIAGILFGTPFYELKIPLQAGSFYILFQKGLTGNIMEFLLPVAAVISGGGIFLHEYESGFLKFSISRTGRMVYIREKTILSCFKTVVTLLAGGLLVLVVYFLYLFPMELKQSIDVEKILETLYTLLRLSLTGGIIAGLSGIFGGLFLNYYMSYGIPFVCYYMLIILKDRYMTKFYSLYPPEWIYPKHYWGKENAGIWYFLITVQVMVILLYSLILHFRLKEIN